MPRKPSTPKYSHHKPTGQARVRLGGNDVYLGKYQSPESYEKYNRVVAEYLSTRAVPAPAKGQGPAPRRDLSINELILAFFTWAEGYYVKNGEPTSEVGIIRTTLRPLKELYGTTSAMEFAPLKLKAVRDRFVAKGYCRTDCNRRARIIVRMFRWGAEHELVPAEIHAALKTVAGLAKGRTPAREMPPIQAAPDADVAAVISRLPRPAAALIEFMRYTGCRPGEACRLRLVDLDRSKPVWIYRPNSHKTEHHERARAILVGPKAQAVVGPLLEGRAPEACVFNPREGDQLPGYRAPKEPVKKTSKGYHPRRTSYSVSGLAQTVAWACRRSGVPIWKPNQLRHLVATEIQAEYSLDGARAVLGHSDAQMTTRYAAHDLKLAAEIMGRIG